MKKLFFALALVGFVASAQAGHLCDDKKKDGKKSCCSSKKDGKSCSEKEAKSCHGEKKEEKKAE
ncbi:MAG: hypothetical protein IT239_03585 [Bacteroidia bacterium]|nr:hypothetical protein [Bacteroidia bacterium]